MCGFKARVGATEINGTVEECSAAFAQYDDALMDGHVAALIDQERPNIFTASLDNLPPGETAVLEISYVALLKNEGDAWRLTFPTTVSPRYMSACAPQIGEPDADRVNPEHWLQVPYGLQFELQIDNVALRSVESVSHLVRTVHSEHGAQVTLTQDDVALDRDLVLLIEPQPMATPQAIAVQEVDGSEIVLVNFRSELAADINRNHEVVFLLDCSPSMAGTSIDEAKRALQLCIRALLPGDQFNIYRFGLQFDSLWPQSRAFTMETLQEAATWLQSVDANLNGTDILSVLRSALAQPIAAGCSRAVVMLTDGQVSNEAEVIQVAKRHANTTPIFALGIGAGASDHLVRGVARASGGEAEMIAPGERIEPKVLRTFRRVRTPRLQNLRLLTGVPQAARAKPRAARIVGRCTDMPSRYRASQSQRPSQARCVTGAIALKTVSSTRSSSSPTFTIGLTYGDGPQRFGHSVKNKRYV